MPIVVVNKRSVVNTRELASILKEFKGLYPLISVFLEHLTPMNRNGRRQGGSSMFSMGRNFGKLEGAFDALDLYYVKIMPSKWKSVMCAEFSAEKKASVLAAKKLFPNFVKMITTKRGAIDHNITDALLIAEWGRQNENRT